MNRFRAVLLAGLACACARGAAPDGAALPGTELFSGHEDMLRGPIRQWDGWLLREIGAAQAGRESFWHRDRSSPDAYGRSIQPNREQLRRITGVVDRRVARPEMEYLATDAQPGPLAENADYEVWPVRWPVLESAYGDGRVAGEGIVFRPKGAARGLVIVLPDADQTPEMVAGLAPGLSAPSQVARRLARDGLEVLVPVLVNRSSSSAGDDRLGFKTNQSNREWIYRQAAEVGHHIIGYEIEKVMAALDWYTSAHPGQRVGVAGYGEGGLIALYSAALDPRIDAAWVSGYFQPRERLWTEPIYRNVWGLLSEFGDAEIAAMVAPRALVVEYSRGPRAGSSPAGKSAARSRNSTTAPGSLVTAPFASVQSEWNRALALAGPALTGRFSLVHGPAGEAVPWGSGPALNDFLAGFFPGTEAKESPPLETRSSWSPAKMEERQRRTVLELQENVQALVRLSEYEREKFFWSKAGVPSSPPAWNEAMKPFRRDFSENLIGLIPDSGSPLHPRTRTLPEYSTSQYTAYEVVLDACPGVATWGILLLPGGRQPGERRPVVVCQHGANGQPSDTLVAEAGHERAYSIYRSYAARLAAQGFVVFSPYNPNSIVGEEFPQLQRKANLIGKSIFSLITLDHRRLLEWLGQQPYVDPARIAFYGMSYGGKTAMRVPAQLEGYCLSVVSGDFNDYALKMTTVRKDMGGVIYSPSYEQVEFDMVNRFSHAEMAAMIAPRPFMVERGYKDPTVTSVEAVAGEYAKVARLYFRLGIPQDTAIEWFDGGHTVHGQETFAFLRHFLRWPAP